MAWAPLRRAALTTSSGVVAVVWTSQGKACEISQFWQNRQRMLQPGVAREKAVRPGRTWKNGFFSMGSTWTEAIWP